MVMVTTSGEAFAAANAAMVRGVDGASTVHVLLADCVELLGAATAGILVRVGDQHHELLASTSHEATALEFVRFLVGEGWLAHWLDFAGDRYLPPMPALLSQPFWLDPSDPHRMRAAIQILTQPHLLDMEVRDHEWRSGPIWQENVWGQAVHRVVADGVSPEQAVDEAIARIKQILSE